MAHNHINEEKLIDFALGNLASDEEKKVTHHLAQCEQCTEEWKGWTQLLNGEKLPTPTPGLANRLQESMDNEPRRRKQWQKPAYVIAGITVVFLLIINLNQLKLNESLTGNEQNGYIMAQHDQIPEQTFMKRPDTYQMDVLPVTDNGQIDGNVWLNKVTNEMFIRVDGLRTHHTSDYQLWLIRTDSNWNGQLLNLQNGSIRVYYRGSDINLLKDIKVSVEPRGGSLAPTGPEAFYVDLYKE